MSKKKQKECSLDEEMLMWTSYRYCIGRKTYVTDLAYYMAQKYYPILSDNRLSFTSEDIHKEIYDHLRWLPFDFNVHRMYSEEKLKPLDYIFEFINRENITSEKEFCSIARLEYHVREDKFEYEKKEPTIKDYFNFHSDVVDLLPWNDLANCFDKSCHKTLTLIDGTEITAFPSWVEKTRPVEGKEGYVTTEGCFGYERVWKSVEDFVNGRGRYKYIPEENIKKID